MNLKAMSFKRLIAAVIALLSVTVIVLSFFSSSFPTGLKIPGVDAPAENSISGRVGADGPVLVVKIDDTSMAHP